MKVSKEQLPNREVRLTVEVDAERGERALRQTARKLSHRTRIPGFRPGKAPFQRVVQTVGEEYLRAEAFDSIGQDLYEQALDQAKIEAFAQGSLEKVEWDPLRFQVTIPLAPNVELGDYHDIRMTPDPIVVLDDDVMSTIEQMREREAAWVPVERAASYGDMLVIDIMGTVADEIIMDQQSWEHVLTEADGGSLPGFDAALVDALPEESREFQLTYPEDAPRWAGQSAKFKVEVHGVKAKELPELNDEFAKIAGDYETLEDLKEAVRQGLHDRQETEMDFEGKVLDELVSHANIEFPPVMLEKELDDLLEDHDRFFRQQGMPLEDYLRISGRDISAYREEQRDHAEKRLRRSLAMGRLIDSEELDVGKEEIDEEIAARVAQLSGENATRLQELLETPRGFLAVRSDLISRKGMQTLLSIVAGEYVKQTDVEAGEEDESSGVDTDQVEQ